MPNGGGLWDRKSSSAIHELRHFQSISPYKGDIYLIISLFDDRILALNGPTEVAAGVG